MDLEDRINESKEIIEGNKLDDKFKKSRFQKNLTGIIMSTGLLLGSYFLFRGHYYNYWAEYANQAERINNVMSAVKNYAGGLFCIVGYLPFMEFARRASGLNPKFKKVKKKKKGTFISLIKREWKDKNLFQAIYDAWKVRSSYLEKRKEIRNNRIANFFNKDEQLKFLKHKEKLGWDHNKLYKRIYQIQKGRKNYDEASEYLIKYINAANEQKFLYDGTLNIFPFIFKYMSPFKDYFYHLEDLGRSFLTDDIIQTIEMMIDKKKKLFVSPEKSLMTALVMDAILKDVNYKPEHWIEFENAMWDYTFHKIYNEMDLIEERVQGSGNIVKKLGNSKVMKKNIIIKENKELEHLLNEKNMIEHMDKVLQDHPLYDVPKIMYLGQHRGMYVLIEQQMQGKLLSDTHNLDKYVETAKFLGIIHKNIKTDKYRDYREVLEKRILESEYDFLKPIVNEWVWVFENIKGERVYDKDPHGLNWICKGKYISGFDFDNKGKVEQEYQLAKLIGHDFLIDQNKIEKILEGYKETYGEVSYKGVLSAIIPTAIGYFTYKVHDNSSINKIRKTFLQNAEIAMKILDNNQLKKYIIKAKELI